MNTQNDMSYGSLWREVPRDLGFLLPLLPIVIFGQVVISTLLSAGAGLVAIFIGIFFLVGRPGMSAAGPAFGPRSLRSPTCTPGATCCPGSGSDHRRVLAVLAWLQRPA